MQRRRSEIDRGGLGVLKNRHFCQLPSPNILTSFPQLLLHPLQFHFQYVDSLALMKPEKITDHSLWRHCFAVYLEKGIILYSLVKTYHCIVFADFQRSKSYSFHNFSLRFILKVFLKFRKFQSRYSYKICSHKKRKSVYLQLSR